MNKYDILVTTVFLIYFFGAICFMAFVPRPNYKKYSNNFYNPKFYDIYYVTAPFGTFKLSGKINGGMFLFMGSLHGEIGMDEVYIVKYFSSSNVLETLTLPAEETKIVVDGTLRLESIFNGHKYKYYYKIHIPKLPTVTPLTDEWIVISP